MDPMGFTIQNTGNDIPYHTRHTTVPVPLSVSIQTPGHPLSRHHHRPPPPASSRRPRWPRPRRKSMRPLRHPNLPLPSFPPGCGAVLDRSIEVFGLQVVVHRTSRGGRGWIGLWKWIKNGIPSIFLKWRDMCFVGVSKINYPSKKIDYIICFLHLLQ